MDRDTIIRLAEEAGLEPRLWNHTDAFERFAALAYERGFVDGMSEQAKRSVDKAVNRMAQPEQKSWFTVEELNEFATKLKEKAWKA